MKNIYRLLAILLTITYAWSVETSTLLETNENIPTDGTEVTYISGETFKNKKVTYSIKDNLAFIEGDILLGTVDEVESWREAQENQANDGKESVIITGSRYRWKNGILPYSIAAGVDNATRRLVSRAIAHWESRTPVRFVRRTARNASKYPSYVEVVSRKPNQCFSSVGQISKSRKQQLNVVAACGFGGVVHEFGHALGLWHEQSRADRNRFIRINYGNIKNGQSHNFNQHITDGDDIGHYDYGSIMHYGRKAFSKNGRDTITVLKSGVSIGQRRGLSAGDIASIKKMYPNKVGKSNITSPRNNTAVQANRNITLRWANRGATRKYLRISARVRGRYQTIYRGNVRGTSKNFRLPTGFTAADVVLNSYNGSRYIGRSSIHLRSRR